jgi:hypothetical protein
MIPVLDHPFLLFAITVAVQWGAAYAGDLIRRRVAFDCVVARHGRRPLAGARHAWGI